MQSSNSKTGQSAFVQQLSEKISLDTKDKYYSLVDKEFEELFAEILGNKLQTSIYLSKGKDVDQSKTVRLEKGKSFKSELLVNLGYRKVDRVWDEGEFSILGDVVILWPKSMKNILRISLWGDEIENIEIVEPGNRRQVEEVDFKDILDMDSQSIVGNENISASQIKYLVSDPQSASLKWDYPYSR
jgi:transcription-repair coupling factor (superfamily II helicase)